MLASVRSRTGMMLLLGAVILLMSGANSVAAQEASPAATPGAANLAAIKAYVVDQATQMRTATTYLAQIGGRYYDLAQGTNFDYDAMYKSNTPEVVGLLAAAKQSWVEAHNHYELNEGLIAGIPSLSYYDVWLDAGPSATEDATNALDWTLTLPDGTTMVKPGNLFHSLAEPMLWGTNPDFVKKAVDLNGDGKQEIGEVLPNAILMKAVFDQLDATTAQMQDAVNEWEPTVEDAFTALVTMLPTMNEYFDQWKLSSFVAGTATTEQSFVGNSRLIDVYDIVHGLQVTFEQVSPEIQGVDPDLNAQITAGFDDLVTFVSDLYDRESKGTVFTADEADLYGSEAQAKATTLVGQLSQAIALLGLTI